MKSKHFLKQTIISDGLYVGTQLLIGTKSISYLQKGKYLGVYIVSGRHFTCCMQDNLQFVPGLQYCFSDCKSDHSEVVSLHLLHSFCIKLH